MDRGAGLIFDQELAGVVWASIAATPFAAAHSHAPICVPFAVSNKQFLFWDLNIVTVQHFPVGGQLFT